MLFPSTGPELLILCAAAGAPILALIVLFVPADPKRLAGQVAAPLMGLALATLAAAAWALNLSAIFQLPLALLGTVGVMGWLLRSPRLWRVVAALVTRLVQPRLLGAALLLAGPALAAWMIHTIEVSYPALELAPGLDLGQVSLEVDPVEQAATDAGRPVPLYRPAADMTSDTAPQGHEAVVIQGSNLYERIIRTGAADNSYNCHGWVFADGRHWVKGEDVPQILADNGYQLVSEPDPGDLAIYRSPDGRIAHSGVVRLTGGPILIESKWGRLGRFLHPPEMSCYGKCFFHRSPRPGHTLRGVGTAPQGVI